MGVYICYSWVIPSSFKTRQALGLFRPPAGLEVFVWPPVGPCRVGIYYIRFGVNFLPDIPDIIVYARPKGLVTTQ